MSQEKMLLHTSPCYIPPRQVATVSIVFPNDYRRPMSIRHVIFDPKCRPRTSMLSFHIGNVTILRGEIDGSQLDDKNHFGWSVLPVMPLQQVSFRVANKGHQPLLFNASVEYVIGLLEAPMLEQKDQRARQPFRPLPPPKESPP